MSTLRKYYQDLLSWEQLYGEPVEQQSDVLRESSEGQQQRDLVAEWPHTLRESIELAFVNAVSESARKTDGANNANPYPNRRVLDI